MIDGRMDCRAVFTLDVEQPRAGARAWADSAGPGSTAAANVERYCEILAEQGVAPTLFVEPELVRPWHGLLDQLARSGCDVGLHLHPHDLGSGHELYLGNLTRRQQRTLLGCAIDAFAQALGRRPDSFRAGHYSANGDTFAVLRELGIQRSSTVLPGRHDPATGAAWRRAPWFPFECQGVLEAPLTSHPRRTLPLGPWSELGAFARKLPRTLGHRGNFATGDAWSHLRRAVAALARPRSQQDGLATAIHPLSLQLEKRDLALLRAVARAHIVRCRRAARRSATLVCTSHSYVPFADRGDRFAPRLRALVAMLRRLPGIDLQFCTLQQLPDAAYARAPVGPPADHSGPGGPR